MRDWITRHERPFFGALLAFVIFGIIILLVW